MNKLITSLLLCGISFGSIIYHSQSDSDGQKVQYLWSKYTSFDLEALQYQYLVSEINLNKLTKMEKLKLDEIDSSLSSRKSISKSFTKLSLKEAINYVSEINNFKHISVQGNDRVIKEAKTYLESVRENQNPSKLQLKSLLTNTPDFAHYRNGEYHAKLKIFLFCRNNRNYPCRLALKDIFNNYVKSEDGSIWSLPTLALSKYALPYNVTNGSTPTGVHLINSVMPEANKQGAFGKFRRIILDWVPFSQNDEGMKHFIPKNSLKSLWWKQASISRDNGRHYLRIHGTGKINNDKLSTYYPHVATSGCVSTLEGKYQQNYIDQRNLLDKMMNAMQLAPVYSNETDIKGVLYVINIDNKLSAVSVEDLENIIKE